MKDLAFFKIEIPRGMWIDFKETITKNQTINNVIIELIKKRIDESKKKNE